jgi:hypothetical protein
MTIAIKHIKAQTILFDTWYASVDKISGKKNYDIAHTFNIFCSVLVL